MRHQDIVSLVRDVMHACDLPEAPRNPRTVARRLGILVVDWFFPDRVSSLLVRPNTEGAVIYVNHRHQLTRQTWHLAHELGHYILHPVGIYAFGHGPARLEREANIAAAEILMPAETVREVVARREPEVPALARVFGVSREAMRLRLGELGLRPSGSKGGGGSSGVHRALGTSRVRDGSDRALQGQRQVAGDP